LKENEKEREDVMIEPEFLNLEIYAIYSAMVKIAGSKKQHEVVNLSGEILFSELKERLNLQEKDPVALVKALIAYLEKVGYFKKGEVEKIKENELLIHMHGAVCHDAVVKLKDEGAYPPHFFTTLAFAGLKSMFNMKVELTHLDLGSKEPPYHTVEKWVLSKIQASG
jgi:hypothetical protein